MKTVKDSTSYFKTDSNVELGLQDRTDRVEGPVVKEVEKVNVEDNATDKG